MLHIKKIKPLFTNILVTGNKYEKDVKENGLIVEKAGELKLYQTVIAVGPMVRGIEVGDTIMFNPKSYEIKQYDPNSVKEDMGMNKVIRYKLPWVTVYDEEDKPQDCLLLTDRDIEFVYEGKEVTPDSSESKLIIPKEKKIIV